MPALPGIPGRGNAAAAFAEAKILAILGGMIDAGGGGGGAAAGVGVPPGNKPAIRSWSNSAKGFCVGAAGAAGAGSGFRVWTGACGGDRIATLANGGGGLGVEFCGVADCLAIKAANAPWPNNESSVTAFCAGAGAGDGATEATGSGRA